MKQVHVSVIAACAMLGVLGSAGGASRASGAQGTPDVGKNEFEARCASCHGVSGKGDGVLRPFLVQAPSDLTTLSRRNGGVFPSQRVWETIDGRITPDIGPHGTREMPIWGQAYRAQAPREQADWHAANRMANLIYYLARIQQK